MVIRSFKEVKNWQIIYEKKNYREIKEYHIYKQKKDATAIFLFVIQQRVSEFSKRNIPGRKTMHITETSISLTKQKNGQKIWEKFYKK